MAPLLFPDPVARCGFQGSPALTLKCATNSSLPANIVASHVAMTYAALVTLLTLGDDLSRVNRRGILGALKLLQNSDGRYIRNRRHQEAAVALTFFTCISSFKAGYGCGESDMRFTYCAVCICYILKDFSSINVPRLVHFIRRSFVSWQLINSNSRWIECVILFRRMKDLSLLDILLRDTLVILSVQSLRWHYSIN